MPIYESICPKCQKQHTYVASIAQRNFTPLCCRVATQKRVLTPPRAKFDIQPWDGYISPATGKYITSNSQRRDDMKASGTRQWEGMEQEKKRAASWKAEEEKKEDAKLDVAVQTAWAQLEPEKKNKIRAGIA